MIQKLLFDNVLMTHKTIMKQFCLFLFLFSYFCDSKTNHKRHHSFLQHGEEGSVLHEDVHSGLCDSSLLLNAHRLEKRSSYLPPITCTEPHENGAYEAKAGCRPRPQVTKLPLPNNTEVQKMTPSHVVVDRCDGSCYHRKQSCLPKRVKNKRIPVMLGLCTIHSVKCEKLCVEVEVEEHIECDCECKIKRHHCNNKQNYRKELCSCQCKDLTEVQACYNSGRVWDPSKCMCRCPLSTLQQCSSKFVFDFTNSCKCIPEESNELSGERIQRSHESKALKDELLKWEILAIAGLSVFVLILIVLTITMTRINIRLKTQLRHSSEVLVPGSGVHVSGSS